MPTTVNPTDSFETIQAAVDGGGTVLFSPGEYFLTQPLVCSKSVTLQGPDPDSVPTTPDRPTARSWPAKLIGGGDGGFSVCTVFVSCTGDHAYDHVCIQSLEIQSPGYGVEHTGGGGDAQDPDTWLQGGSLSVDSCKITADQRAIRSRFVGDADILYKDCELKSYQNDTIIVSFSDPASVEISGNYIQVSGWQQAIEFLNIHDPYGGPSCTLVVNDNVMVCRYLAVVGLDLAASLEFRDNLVKCNPGGLGMIWGSSPDVGGIIEGNTFEHGSLLLGGAGHIWNLGAIDPTGVNGIHDFLIRKNCHIGTSGSAIHLGNWGASENTSSNNVIMDNDYTCKVSTGPAHVVIGPQASGNTLKKNHYGPAGISGHAGVICDGMDNDIKGERFVGFPGWGLDGDGELVGSGCVLLSGSDNVVTSLKSGDPPYGFDICFQVIDLSGMNLVRGHEKCATPLNAAAARKYAELVGECIDHEPIKCVE